MSRKRVIICAIVLLALAGASIGFVSLWNNYQNHQAETENTMKLQQMHQVLLAAQEFGMYATGLPEQNNILAYSAALSQNPDDYSRVEFALTWPLLEDCEWGVIYIVPSETSGVRLGRLNTIIQNNPSMELNGLSYPLIMNDYPHDLLAFYDIVRKLGESQYDEFKTGKTRPSVDAATQAIIDENKQILLDNMDIAEGSASVIARNLSESGVTVIVEISAEFLPDKYYYDITFTDSQQETYWMGVGVSGTAAYIGQLRKGDSNGELIFHAPIE
jgi:hypothetical protein